MSSVNTVNSLRSLLQRSDAFFLTRSQDSTALDTVMSRLLLELIDEKLTLDDLPVADRWTGVDSATTTNFEAAYGHIYSVDVTADNVAITLPTEAPALRGSTEISFYDRANNWSVTNTITVNADGFTFNTVTPPFTATEPGNGRILKFARVEDILNPGTYLNDWTVRELNDSSTDIIQANRADTPNPGLFKFWIVLDELTVEFSDTTSWNKFF